MMLVKMNEAYLNYITKGGVFSGMTNLPWSDTITPQQLDTIYLETHSGERYTSHLISRNVDEDSSLPADMRTNISRLVQAMFITQWTKLWATMKPTEYDPLTNYKMEETLTGTHSDTRTPDLTRKHTGTSKDDGNSVTTGKNNLWGFNSDTSVPSDMSDANSTTSNTTTNDLTDTETGTDTTSGNKSHTLTRTGNIGTNTFQNLLQQERKVWMFDFFSKVFKDVDSILTIPIY